MQRPQSRDELLRLLEKSHLVTAEQLSEVQQATLEASDAAAAGQQMSAMDVLSEWQLEQLLAGRSKFYVDKYKLIGQLGVGGMGAVFLAEHAVMGRRVALKVLTKARLASDAAVQRFRREVKAAAKLDHPNIIAAHDAGVIRGVHFLVMEHMDGSDLLAWYKQYGRLPVSWACEFIRQAALGLEHAHGQGMVHRDIKPGNILVCWDDPEKPPAVKILDLGLARFTHEADIPDSKALSETADGGLTQVGQILGTPDYLAPEQIRRTHDVDIRADIFSLGCTLFKLLTGQTPFGGRNVVEKLQARIQETAPPAVGLCTLRDDAPAELESIVARMLDRDPNRRFQTPAEVAVALEPFAWQPGMPVAVAGMGPMADVGGYTPTIDVTASRFAKEMDSGTRTFLGSLAGEASDLDGPTPPVATPAVATPVTPVPVPRPTRQAFGEVSTSDSRMMSLRRPRRGSPALLIAGGVGLAAVLMLMLIFAAGSVEQPVAEKEEPIALPEVTIVRPIQDDDRPNVIDRPRIDQPRPEQPDDGFTFMEFPPVTVPNNDQPEPNDDELEYEPGFPIAGGWRPRHHVSDDGTAPGAWRPGQPFPIVVDQPRDSPAPRKSPPRKSGPLPRTTIKWTPSQQTAAPPLRVLKGHSKAVTAVAISRDSKRIVSGSEDTTLRVWQWESDESPKVLTGHGEAITDVTFLHAASRVASASSDKTIRVWDVIRGEHRITLKGHTVPVLGLSALGTSPMLSFAKDGLRGWNPSSGGQPFRYKGPASRIVGIGHTTTGPRVLYAESSGLLRCFQPTTGQEKFRVNGMPLPSCAAFSVDGRYLAIGSENGWLYLVDINSRKPPAQIPAHSGGVHDVTFGPGKLLVSCGADGSVRVQQTTGATTFRGPKGPVHCVDVSASGKLIASGHDDGTVHVWELE